MPHQAQRTIRVFVSSTFRDMVAERNELATHGWPALRALCESRAVTFTDVDLRWGITEEQADRGEVLPICLAEIDASRPFFIGILGERYGWVPETIPDHLVEAMPWLAEHRTASVTELEIVHGVLSDAEQASRALFYFRDPAAAERVPADSRASFLAENPDHAERLLELKARIRATPGVIVREGFSTPAELVEQVVADITAIVEQLFPAEAKPDPIERARFAHEAYSRSRREVHVGREGLLLALDAHAASDDRPLVVTGESGSGKSALVANWATRHRTLRPEDIVIEHYCGAGADAADWDAMCRRISDELSRATGLGVELPIDSSGLKEAFSEALHRFATARRVVLVIDGVNQLSDSGGALDLAWLPLAPPAELRLVISTLTGRPLEEARRRSWNQLDVPPLSHAERGRLLEDYLASFSKALDAELATEIAQSRHAGNPLFLRTLLDELRVAANHEALPHLARRYLAVSSVDNLFELMLERWERDYGREREGLVRDALTALWAARHGLSETELLAVLGEAGVPMPRATLAPLWFAARPALVDRSGLTGFAHDFMRAAVADRYLADADAQRAAHARLAEWFGQQDRLAKRTVQELPWQLFAASNLDRAHELLIDDEFLASAWGYDAQSVIRLWTMLEASGDFSAVRDYEESAAAYVRFPPSSRDATFEPKYILLSLRGWQAPSLLPRRAQFGLVLVERVNRFNVALFRYVPWIRPFRRWFRFDRYGMSVDRDAVPERLRGLLRPTATEDSGSVFVTSLHLLERSADLERQGALEDSLEIARESLERVLGALESMPDGRFDDTGALLAYKASRKCISLSLRMKRAADALAFADRALSLTYSSASTQQARRAWLLADRSRVLERLGRTDEAVTEATRATQSARNLGEWQALAHALRALAEASVSTDPHAALAFGEEAAEILRTNGDMVNLAEVLLSQGRCALSLGEADSALRYFDELEAIAERIGDVPKLAGAPMLQAITLRELGRTDEARVRAGVALSRLTPLEKQSSVYADLAQQMRYLLGQESVS